MMGFVAVAVLLCFYQPFSVRSIVSQITFINTESSDPGMGFMAQGLWLLSKISWREHYTTCHLIQRY
jgi:hypothetical protein